MMFPADGQRDLPDQYYLVLTHEIVRTLLNCDDVFDMVRVLVLKVNLKAPVTANILQRFPNIEVIRCTDFKVDGLAILPMTCREITTIEFSHMALGVRTVESFGWCSKLAKLRLVACSGVTTHALEKIARRCLYLTSVRTVKCAIPPELLTIYGDLINVPGKLYRPLADHVPLPK